MSIRYTLLNVALLVMASYGSYAQQAMVSTGTTITAPEGSVSYSIGQVAFLNASESSGSLNQGVQQTYTVQQVSVKEPPVDIGLKVYPNPTTDIIWIEANSGYASLSYRLTDAAGRILMQATPQANKYALSLQAYATGTYFLNILRHQSLIQTFKITKTN